MQTIFSTLRVSTDCKVALFSAMAHAHDMRTPRPWVMDGPYALWETALKGNARESKLGWGVRIAPNENPSLLATCCHIVSERILINMLHDFDRVSADDCVGLVDRAALSLDTLDAFVAKGLDLEELLVKGIHD